MSQLSVFFFFTLVYMKTSICLSLLSPVAPPLSPIVLALALGVEQVSSDMGPAVEDDAVLERDNQVKPIALYRLPARSNR